MPNIAPQPEPLEATAVDAPSRGKTRHLTAYERHEVLWVTLAVFAQESVWNFYDAQVPSELRHYIASAGLVGLIMGMDNSMTCGRAATPRVTFDFMCHDQAAYDALVASGFLNRELFADLYGADPADILLVNHPLALAVKVSLPRPTVQGDLHDSDCYAGQQYAP